MSPSSSRCDHGRYVPPSSRSTSRTSPRARRPIEGELADSKLPLARSQTFTSLVTSTEPTSPSHATARNNLLAYSYLHLGAPLLAQPGSPALPPWHLFGCLAADWIQRCTRPRPDTGVPDCPSRDVNRVLNGVLRQELVRATVEAAARGPDPAIDEFEARLWEVVACGRTLKELERAELGDEARARLVKGFREEVLDPKANALLERTMKDAQVQSI